MAFKTTIRKARFEYIGFSGEQMAQAANGLITRGIIPRIQSAKTVDDSPAPPLTPRYAKQKAKKAPPAVRNWTYTGRTLRSMKVLSAAPNRAEIRFSDAETNKRAAINNVRSRQFGVSGSDRVVLADEFGKLPPHTRAVSN